MNIIKCAHAHTRKHTGNTQNDFADGQHLQKKIIEHRATCRTGSTFDRTMKGNRKDTILLAFNEEQMRFTQAHAHTHIHANTHTHMEGNR